MYFRLRHFLFVLIAALSGSFLAIANSNVRTQAPDSTPCVDALETFPAPSDRSISGLQRFSPEQTIVLRYKAGPYSDSDGSGEFYNRDDIMGRIVGYTTEGDVRFQRLGKSHEEVIPRSKVNSGKSRPIRLLSVNDVQAPAEELVKTYRPEEAWSGEPLAPDLYPVRTILVGAKPTRVIDKTQFYGLVKGVPIAVKSGHSGLFYQGRILGFDLMSYTMHLEGFDGIVAVLSLSHLKIDRNTGASEKLGDLIFFDHIQNYIYKNKPTGLVALTKNGGAVLDSGIRAGLFRREGTLSIVPLKDVQLREQTHPDRPR